MKRLRRLFVLYMVLLFAASIFPTAQCLAGPPGERSALGKPAGRGQLSVTDKASHRLESLEQSDPGVSDLATWEHAVQQLKDAVDAERSAARRAEALFVLGESNRRMYEKRDFLPGLARAAYAYQALLDETPDNEHAEEALYRLAVLKEEGFRSPYAAQGDLQRLVQRYPAGRYSMQARAKLDKLAAGGADVRPDFPDFPPAVEGAAGPTHGVGRPPVIVLDPGHGGEDLGAVGIDGVLEKDVVLNVAVYLDELLRERLRAKTVLTRVRDVVVPLAERTKTANDANADLFVSIHTNASPSHSVYGIETYYLDNTEDRSSLKLAERENVSIAFGGGDVGDLSFILSDLIQSGKLEDSISLAHHLQTSLHLTLSGYFNGVKSLGVKRAPFYVLVGAHMPCVLAEVSFIDHPIEGARLIEPRYQRLVAEALFKGIQNFFQRRE